MQIKEEKRFDVLNNALMQRIVHDLNKTYNGENGNTFVLAVQYIMQHYDSKELLHFFEKQYGKEDNTVYPVYQLILDNALTNIDKKINKYRKFRRINDKLEEELLQLKETKATELPLQILTLDVFLTYTLTGREMLRKELERKQDSLTSCIEHITKAYVCLFHLAQIKGATKQRDNIELMATELLRNSTLEEPKSDIDVLFDLLQEGFY